MDDGDIWSRGHEKFEGKWTKATISKNILTWSEGEEVTINILSATSFGMIYANKVYTAELQNDGALHWDDGDVWHLVVDKVKSTAELPPWLCRRRPRGRVAVSAVCEDSCDHMALHCDDCQIALYQTCASQPCTSTLQEESAMAVAERKIAHRDRLEWSLQTETESKTLVPQIPSADSEAASTQGTANAPMALAPINANIYQGLVKWFRGSYGWLVCKSLTADYPGCDVLVHKSECDFKPRLGDRVCFRLAVNHLGHPQAVKVTMRLNH